MAEWPSGQDDEGWPEPDGPDSEEIEEIEGTVVPFPARPGSLRQRRARPAPGSAASCAGSSPST